MITCPKCGAQNLTELKVCKRCWASLLQPEASQPAPPAEPPEDPKAHGTSPPQQRGPLFGVGYMDATYRPAEAPRMTVGPGPLAQTPGNPSFEGFSAYAPTVTNSPRSTAAIIFSVLAVLLFCLFHMSIPIDLVAIILGVTEIKAIHNGTAPIGGRAYALTGLIVGSLTLSLKILILVLLIL